MAETVVDELLISIRLKTEALEQGMAQVRSQLEENSARVVKMNKTEEQAAGRAANAQKLAAAEVAQAVEWQAQRIKDAQTKVAAAATAAFAVIVAAIKSGIDAANEYNNAMVGLKSMADGVGQDFGDLQSAAEDLTADGLMPMADAATALKNLLARGFSTQEAVTMIKRLKDASAFGRQGQLSMGEAVKSATEGLKNENSVLVDNAGVTKNVSVMWKEYAKSIGKSVDDLSIAEKRQAEYNGLLQETAYQVGDAARYAQEYAGKQAALEAATLHVNQALGATAQTALSPLLEAVTPILDAIAQWIEQNPALTAGLVTTAAAGTALAVVMFAVVPAVKMLAKAFWELQASLGIIGLIGLAAGVIAGIAVACANAKTPVEELTEEFEDLKSELRSLSESSGSADAAFKVLKDGAATTEELAAAKQALARAIPEAVIGYDSEGNAVLATNDVLEDHIELLRLKREETLRGARETSNELAKVAQLEAEVAQIKIDKLNEGRVETVAYYNDLLAEAQNYSAEEKALLESYRDDALAQNASERAAAELELANAHSQVSLKLQEQYAIENELMGERNAATQLAMEYAMQEAALQQLNGEEYLALLQRILGDEEQMLAFTEKAAQAELERAQAAKDAAEAVKALTSAEDALQTASSAAKQKQKTQMLKAYVNEVKNGTKGSKTYEKAVAALKDQYGDLYPNIENSIGAIEDLVRAEDDAAQGAVDAAHTAIKNLMATQQAIVSLEGASVEAVTEAQNLINVLATLDAALAGLGSGNVPSIDLGTSSSGGGGGGGGSRKSRWEKELEELEHYAALGEDVTQRQIDAIQRILETQKLSTEERWQLEEELYDKTNQLIEDRISLYKGLTDLTAQEASQQAASIQYMLNTYSLSTQERAALEQQLSETKKALDGDYLRDYIAHLERILQAEQLNAAQRKNILTEIMDARVQLMQKEQEAMREQTDAQISAIEEQRDARIAAIDKEIAALDDLLQARKRAQQQEDDQDVLRRLQESLLYEKDDYNRQQLEKRITDKQKEIADRQFEQGIQDQKDALKEKQDSIRDSAAAEIKMLQEMAEQKLLWYDEQLEMQQEYGDMALEMQGEYGELTLEGQQTLYTAQHVASSSQNADMNKLTDEGQRANVDTLLSYEGEWSGAGNTLGGALQAALQAHFDQIEAAAASMAASVASIVASAMAQMSSLSSITSGSVNAGTKAVDKAVSGKNGVVVTQNFYTPTTSPSTVRAANRQLAQELAK